MAIRFVDKDPEEPAKAKTPKREARIENPAPPEAETPAFEGDLLSGSNQSKPAPKPRGRKPAQPVAAAPTSADAPLVEDQPGEALLPGLQVHAKPTPKPRGRKKAFG